MGCKLFAVVFVSFIVFPCLAPFAASRTKQGHFTGLGPLVVSVRRTDGQLEYRCEDKQYSKHDLNFQLAEMKLHDGPRRVIVMLDPSTYLSDLKLVPQMAINAGFTDIQVFAVWPDTGTMAEVVFGPVKKISRNPDTH